MNSWPTLIEWGEFAGVLALELLVLFAAAKLISLRVRSAQWQRGIWQITLMTMLLALAGELNGAREWLRWPRQTIPAKPQQNIVATGAGGELTEFPPLLPVTLPSELATLTPQAPQKIHSLHGQAIWPAGIFVSGTIALLLRFMIAQLLTLGFRSTRRRWSDIDLSKLLQRLAELFRVRRQIVLARSFKTIAPFTFGIWRPVVVLPNCFKERFTAQQQQVALAHEVAHIAGCDAAWRALSHLLCALLWWNPLVWLAKRELDHASEIVADESSLLIADGPNQLAECLVLCAKTPRHPAFAAWLGIDGGGFRSALGERIARLLRLPVQPDVGHTLPWYWRLIAPLLYVVALWMGMSAFDQTSSDSRPNWRSSILGRAFAAGVVEPKQTNSISDTRLEAARLVQDGKLYYEVGRLSEAETNLQMALRLEPTHQGALYYLDLVRARQFAADTRLRESPISPRRQGLYDRLRSTRLTEWGPIDNAPLSEVIRSLSEQVRRGNPDGGGINFIVSSNSGVPAVDSAGLPIAAPDINNASVRLGTTLRGVTVEEALNILSTITESKLKYSVEDYGVIISPKSPDSVPLHTRFFHVDLESLPDEIAIPPTNAARRFRSVETPVRPQSGNQTVPVPQKESGIRFLSEATPGARVIPWLRNYLLNIGINLNESNKALFFNDRLNVLMVRATLPELDTIEKLLPKTQRLTNGLLPSIPGGKTNAALPNGERYGGQSDPVAFPTRAFAIDSNSFWEGLQSVRELNLGGGGPRDGDREQPQQPIEIVKGYFLTAGADFSAPGKSIFFDDRGSALLARGTAQDFQIVTKALEIIRASRPQLSIEVKAFEVSKNDARGFEWYLDNVPLHRVSNAAATNTAGTSNAVLKGILSSEHHLLVLRLLESRAESESVGATKITTLSGRQTSVKIARQGSPLPKSTGRPAGAGIGDLLVPLEQQLANETTFELVPFVMTDRHTIQMTVLPTGREFVSHEPQQVSNDTWATGGPFATPAPRTLAAPISLPKFRFQPLVLWTVLYDGQTLVFEANSPSNKKHVFFVTPRVIGSDGQSENSEDVLKALHKNAPPQRDRVTPQSFVVPR